MPNPQPLTPNPYIFGIRHHGPGSARSLKDALEALQPDCILVEGPPDADELIPFVTDAEIRPPVAILVYDPEHPLNAVYYPFAVFSPEWQAMHYAVTNKVPVQFMDLPQAHQLITPDPTAPSEPTPPTEETPPPPLTPNELIRRDPLTWLAEAAGYSDGERWWEHIVEQRRDSGDVFGAILEAMTAVREKIDEGRPANPHEAQREAHMRQAIRAAQKQGYQKIAVVCGAWHGPALVNLDQAKEDAALLKGLPTVKVQATWVPWTHGRLSYDSGYGAGIESPGWYDHLWTTKSEIAIHWLTKVARLLRSEDLDASSAHIIEAVRLAEALAAIRERPIPGLPELNEASQAILCFGDEAPMRLIHRKLIVGETLGQVPESTPMVPLQRDLTREQKRLRLKPDPVKEALALDLRKDTDLGRSHLLHRLTLLNVPWGKLENVGRLKKGTFHENWTLEWQPEFAVGIIEAGIWGTTLVEAATALTRHQANTTPDLPALTKLVDRALLADLPEAIAHLMTRLQAEAALASDLGHLMDALPPLANVMRYGNVRRADTNVVAQVVDGLVTRICIGLPGACASLNDDAATERLTQIGNVQSAVALLESVAQSEAWNAALIKLANQGGLHGLIAGRVVRLLLDTNVFSREEAARRLSLALSTASEPAQAATWIEGFLQGSGLLLLHDEALWQIIDDWVSNLSPEAFVQLLPLLRRTFSAFTTPERRMMGEKVKGVAPTSKSTIEVDEERADAVLPLLEKLLGL